MRNGEAPARRSCGYSDRRRGAGCSGRLASAARTLPRRRGRCAGPPCPDRAPLRSSRTRRERVARRTIARSTTTSILCLRRWLSLGGSSRLTDCPSTRDPGKTRSPQLVPELLVTLAIADAQQGPSRRPSCPRASAEPSRRSRRRSGCRSARRTWGSKDAPAGRKGFGDSRKSR